MGIMEVPLAAASAAVEGSGYGHHMWYGEGHGGFMGPFAMVVLLLVAVVVAVLLIRWLGATRPPPPAGNRSTSSRNASPGARSTRRSTKNAAASWVVRPACVERNSSRVGKRDRAPVQSRGKARVASERQTTRD